MNTQGVPCTIKHIEGKRMEQIDHIDDKKDEFNNSMIETQSEYKARIE